MAIKEQNAYSNLQAELDVLGCMYKYDDIYRVYGTKLSSNDFTHPDLSFFYKHLCLMKNMFDRGAIIDKGKLDYYFGTTELLLKEYASHGGFSYINGIMQACAERDAFQTNLELLKKYSLLREYSGRGIDIQAMLDKKSTAYKKYSLNDMTSQDIYDFLLTQVKETKIEIMQPMASHNLGSGIADLAKKYLQTPRQGIQMPFPILSEIFMGLRTQKVMGIGMLSNLGKTRMLVSMIAHTALIEHKKCLLLVNEMTEEDVKLCLLITVLNDPIYRPLYESVVNMDGELVSQNILMSQKNFSTGSYIDSQDSSLITKKSLMFDESDPDEISTEEYYEYVKNHSKQFKDVIAISEWLEQEISGRIFVKDICDDYRDNKLVEEISLSHTLDGVDFFFYDTLKSYDEGHNADQSSWKDLVGTSERLKFLANSLNVFIGFTFQLTDDTTWINAIDLSSMNIASCKHLKHNVDALILANKIKPQTEIEIYNIQKDITDPTTRLSDIAAQRTNRPEIDANTHYYLFKVDKNRDGSAGKSVVLKVNLDLNVWQELGYATLAPGKISNSGGFNGPNSQGKGGNNYKKTL